MGGTINHNFEAEDVDGTDANTALRRRQLREQRDRSAYRIFHGRANGIEIVWRRAELHVRRQVECDVDSLRTMSEDRKIFGDGQRN